jgi:hypothetical protein
MSKSNLGWHFMDAENGWPVLRDGGLPPPVGKPLRYRGDVVMCHSGLHASRRAIDAARYAPGAYCARVKFSKPWEEHGDKLVSRQRTILWLVNAELVLLDFARWCALSVIDKWDAPPVVRQWLETGDESVRYAAWYAARSAAESDAWYAAWHAARSAAWSAAWSATWSTTWSTTRAADWSAAWHAAEAAWYAAGAAPRSAAKDAPKDAQNEQLEAMLCKAPLIAGERDK